MPDIIINGQLVPENEAHIPITDRGFRYGDGLFETIRIHKGVPYQFQWHIQRLQKGLNAIKLKYDPTSLKTHCSELLKHNDHKEGLLRIQITRGSSGGGYLPGKGSPTCVIETLPLTQRPEGAISLWLSDYRRIPDNALPVQSKLCQGMNSTLARMEAQENGCFDALQMNQQNVICETSSANIFWTKQQSLFTPALDCGVLEGSARAALCKLAEPVHTIHARLKDLESADAVCIANVSWGVVPVSSLEPEGYNWESDDLAKKLRGLLSEDIAVHTTTHATTWQNT